MKALRLDVYGREVVVLRKEGRWRVFYIGLDGKSRPAADIIIPSSVSESEVKRYIADLCHEWATKGHPDVRQLD